MTGPRQVVLVSQVASPIGELTLFVRGAALCAAAFEGRVAASRQDLERRLGPLVEREAADPGGIASRLRAYFAGSLTAIEQIAVDTGGTAFQTEVWAALRGIAPGQVCSYGELARMLGRPSAMRAVGAANGRNPIPVVIPCHRVVASDGTLHGYGGGLERKRWLLEHEGAAFRDTGAPARQARLF